MMLFDVSLDITTIRLYSLADMGYKRQGNNLGYKRQK